MATAEQIGTYFRALAAASDRIRLIDIGPTTEGRRQHLTRSGNSTATRASPARSP
jgi:hypothetical protein